MVVPSESISSTASISKESVLLLLTSWILKAPESCMQYLFGASCNQFKITFETIQFGLTLSHFPLK